MPSLYPSTPPMSGFNGLGLWTLYRREVWRFSKVWNQTIIAPVITTLLYLAIFTLALGHFRQNIGAIPFNEFIAPGLVMMAVVQNAFANSSSSLMLSKIQGVIIDILMPPLSAMEITLAYMLGGITRGLCVGLCVYLGMSLFVPLDPVHPWLALLYIVLASMLLALLGVACGMWAQTFDQMAAITNYIVIPLSFLSGTFYPIKRLPEFWQQLSHLDPFFYMIDGFRYAITGYADSSPTLGITVLLTANVVVFLFSLRLIHSGYRLKQ